MSTLRILLAEMSYRKVSDFEKRMAAELREP